MLPIGHASPFDRQNVTVSAQAAISEASTPSATEALKIRAPSRWTRRPCEWAASLAALRSSRGHTTPPCRLCVFSKVIAAVSGWCGSSRGRTASTICRGDMTPALVMTGRICTPHTAAAPAAS